MSDRANLLNPKSIFCFKEKRSDYEIKYIRFKASSTYHLRTPQNQQQARKISYNDKTDFCQIDDKAQPSIMFRTIIYKQTSKARSIHPLSYHPHTSRVISTFQPRRNTDNDTDHDNGNHHHDSSQHASPGSPPGVSWKEFTHLDKDVSNIKLKLDHIQSGQAEMRADIKDVG
ncbi:unnamed protein product [Tuber aestivum]|uniref:Uncharacterized protein n=1 Tax=Tuber aestivum TaxID=59557 RepID=A0A292PM14_9PEZI|nr:unnamed protein product [Tuber aestivum]